MSVKTGEEITGTSIEEQRAECRRRYQAAVREFTTREAETLESLLEEVRQPLEQHYRTLARLPWRFLKVADFLEGGLPHTRHDAIVLSEQMLENLAGSRAAGREGDGFRLP
jgi:hypothetical protein